MIQDLMKEFWQYRQTAPFLFYLLISAWILLLFAILFLIYNAINSLFLPSLEENATIIDKLYTGATHSSGIGVGMGPNGAVPIITSSDSPEEFNVVCQNSTGEVFKASCNMAEYYQHKIGDSITVLKYYGRIDGELDYAEIKSNK